MQYGKKNLRRLFLSGLLALSVIGGHLIPCAHAAEGEIASPRLRELAAAVSAGDQAATGRFWQEIDRSRTPLIELPADAPADMLVTFLWRAQPKQDQVAVGVAPRGLVDWKQFRDPLQRLGQTDVWYKTYRASRKARFSYNLVWPQGQEPRADALYRETRENGLVFEVVRDPLSRLTYTSEGEEGRQLVSSYAEGPDAPPEPYIAERKGVPRGALDTLEVESRILGNRRKVSIYTPPGYRPKGAPYGLLLVFDRGPYLSDVPTPVILDNLLADGMIPPLIAVLVDSSVTNDPDGEARGRELPPSPPFQRFLREELVPLVRASHPVSNDPRRNVVAGSSYGGIAAAFTAFSSPDIFGNVVSQSGSYWWDPQCCYPRPQEMVFLGPDAAWLVKQFAAAPKKPLRFYMDVGLWEGADMVLPNRILRTVLEGKGYPVTYQEFTGGHDYLNWRGTLSDGLMAVVGTGKAKAYLRRQLNP